MEKIQEDMLKLPPTPNGYFRDVINGKYTLSKDGILVHKRTRKVVKGSLSNDGYIHDNFRVDGKIICKRRNRLVWETFNGEIPKRMQVNHINEIKTDNRLENLNLMTCKENINYGTGIERSKKARSKSVIQKSLQGEVIKIWTSAYEVQRQLGYAQQHICNCCNGNRKTAYNYIWEYTN